MHIILLVIIVAALVFGPSLWAKWVLARHGDERSDFPGTGGELARHLLDAAGLKTVTVEASAPGGDHYDPEGKAVRLSPAHLDGASLTAVTVAAHEVGHALQDRDGYAPLRSRSQMVKFATFMQKAGSVLMLVAIMATYITSSPTMLFVMGSAAIATMASAVLVHLITLPVEFDASFNRALPILEQGGYLPPEDMPAARHILKACAMTYVAGSLASLLNLARWIRYWR